MTNRYTDAEWKVIIDELDQDIVTTDKPRRIPPLLDPSFNKTIDHTLLKLEATSAQIDQLCSEARAHGFARNQTVCVRPPLVERSVMNLKRAGIKVASVIGFHEGTYDTYHKLQETKESLSAGASELDIVVNWPLLKESKYETIFTELAVLRETAPHPTILKLILETSQLTRHEIVAACSLAAAAKFDFVKTSTGFVGHGATKQDVQLMVACCERLAVGSDTKMQVKASGGVRTLEDAITMLRGGASRLGTSAGVWIAKGAREAAGGSNDSGDEDRPGMQTRTFSDY